MASAARSRRAQRAARAALSERLESALRPLGFEADASGAAHVNLRGRHRGREIRVQATALSGGRRAVIDVQGETSVSTRLVSQRLSAPFSAPLTWLHRFRRLRPFALVPGADGVRLWASDPAWARALSSHPRAREPLERATVGEAGSHTVFRMGPGRLGLSFQTPPGSAGDAIVPFLETVAELCWVAEELPPPEPIELTWLEKLQDRNPRAAVYVMAVAILFGLPVALMGAVGLAALVAFLLGGSDAVGAVLVAFGATVLPIGVGALIWRALYRRRLRRQAGSASRSRS